MKDRVRQRIGMKLFILLSGLVVLTISPFGYIVFTTLIEFGHKTDQLDRQAESNRAYSYLTTLTRERAHHYDSFFSQVESAVSLMAAQVREVYNDIDHYVLAPSAAQEELGQLQWGLPSYSGHDVSTVFRPEIRVRGEMRRELMALMYLDPVLKGAQSSVLASVSTHLISATGICRYYVRSLQTMGKSLARSRNPLLYPEINVAFRAAQDSISGNTPDVIWTTVYNDHERGQPMLTAMAPVVDRQGWYRGVAGMDISLSGELNQFFRDYVSDTGWGAERLFTFLLGEDGEVITFPESYRDLFGLPENFSRVPDQKLPLLKDSTTGAVAQIASKITASVDTIAEIELDGKSYILSSHTLHKLNWHLVQVNGQVRQIHPGENTRQVLSGTISDLALKFIVLSLLTLLITIIAVYFAVQDFVKPLNNMARNAELVGMGDLSVRCQVKREDELGILAKSFNTMVARLERIEGEKREEARWLELLVRERTVDLQQKNIVLHDLIEELRHKEVELLESQSMLQGSLEEKEILLREIYHRTKNNMLVIISMLQLQALEAQDSGVKVLFVEMENRIRAMSMVHEKLYQSQNLADIELSQYLHDMVTALVNSMVMGEGVQVDCDCEKLRVSIDSAVPLGLAINEIVTNSLKHAFRDAGPGRIFVRLHRLETGAIELVVGDDGCGLSQQLKPDSTRSLGMQIATNLITRQLRGQMEMLEGAGVVYKITFTESVRSRRV